MNGERTRERERERRSLSSALLTEILFWNLDERCKMRRRFAAITTRLRRSEKRDTAMHPSPTRSARPRKATELGELRRSQGGSRRLALLAALVIPSAPEDAGETLVSRGGGTNSRVRHLTPLIRRRSSGIRKSRTGSDITATGTWSRRADQRG